MEHVAELKLKVLFEVSKICGQALDMDLETALTAILGVCSETLAMKRATVTLVDDETGHLVIKASHGLTPEEKSRGVYRLDEGVTGRIFQTGEPFVAPDLSKEPLFLNRTGARKLEKSRLAFIGVPIMADGRPMGVLNVDRLFGDQISFEEDIDFLTVVAVMISQIIRLHSQMRAREDGLRRENLNLRMALSRNYQRFFIVGKSPAMAQVHQMIEKVAPTKATVLLLGESGTGKTLIARIIHELSDRAKHPFIKVNCAAIPDGLLESELFGFERGAFTGAVSPKPGRFEDASGGTIFLDEIGELPPQVQAKLLRFLQEREFERLGGVKTRKVDVRIVAATNIDMDRAARAGLFREDLYYRLNVFPLRVPPLRERREDIPALLNHFLDKHSREYGRRLYFSREALDTLTAHAWPGNVREMENLIERLAIMVEGERIDWRDLAPVLSAAAKPVQDAVFEDRANPKSLKELERREVVAALERHGWVQVRAARELGLTVRQIGYRIKKFGLENKPEA